VSIIVRTILPSLMRGSVTPCVATSGREWLLSNPGASHSGKSGTSRIHPECEIQADVGEWPQCVNQRASLKLPLTSSSWQVRALDRQIHRQIVAVGPCQALIRAGGVDQTRVEPVQHLPAEAEPVHNRGREFSSNTSPRSTIRNNSARPRSCFRFNVIARLLEFSIAIGKVVLLPGGARRAQRLALRRLNLDYIGRGLGHQQGRVRPLIDLAEIEHDDAR
jgi:hypothetical protein